MVTYKTIKIISFVLILIMVIADIIILTQFTGWIYGYFWLMIMGLVNLLICLIIIVLFFVKAKGYSKDSDLKWIK